MNKNVCVGYIWMSTQIAMMMIELEILSYIAEMKIGYQWKRKHICIYGIYVVEFNMRDALQCI